MQLALDTSTTIASIALADKGETIAELTWRCGQNHTAQLLPRLVQLLQNEQASLASVDAIIVAQGPGSFNGLRVGISTAKALAFALNVPLIGVTTLEAEALPFADTGRPICPIHDAGRGEIATALYQQQKGKWEQRVEPHITLLVSLQSEIKERTIFCGELSAPLEIKIHDIFGELAIVPRPVTRLRRAGSLAYLGWQRLLQKDFADSIALQPLYLRRPAVTQPRAKLWQGASGR